MIKQSFTPFQELHSEAVHEIISRPPHWLLRWGITLFFGLMMVLVAGMWLIRYPDIVTVPFILTSTDAPRKVVVRSEGKLAQLLVTDGQTVAKGQSLAYSESTGDPMQILKLESSIVKIHRSVEQGHWSAITDFNVHSYTNLGELQGDFELFHQKLTALKAFLNNGFYQKKRGLLTEDYHDLAAMEAVLIQQQDLQAKDFELAKDEFQMQEKLHASKVIAALEYKKEKARLLAREMPLKGLASSLIQNKAARIAKQKEMLELDNVTAESKLSFEQTVQSLRSSIAGWKQMYILTAPVSGKVAFSEPLQEQQHLAAGKELMTVEPSNSTFQGLVQVPQQNLGKVTNGQTVLIKLDGYPYREYGMVEGSLSSLSAVPGKDSIFWGYVALPHKLTTRYGHKLSYRNGLKGSAEIITADRRLAERLVSLVRGGGK